MFDNGTLTIGIAALITVLVQSGAVGYWVATYKSRICYTYDKVQELEKKYHEIDKDLHSLKGGKR